MDSKIQTDAQNVAINLEDVFWHSPQGLTRFVAQRPGYGIQNAEGLLLSRDGVSPCAWDRKKVVEQMLPYADDFDNHTWIKPATEHATK